VFPFVSFALIVRVIIDIFEVYRDGHDSPILGWTSVFIPDFSDFVSLVFEWSPLNRVVPSEPPQLTSEPKIDSTTEPKSIQLVTRGSDSAVERKEDHL